MSRLTVITAVDPARSEHLPATWESLSTQKLPDGWDWEWLVQCDSTAEEDAALVRSRLPDDPRVSFGTSRRGGPGIARTIALARAHGQLVKTLDADDRLTDGALARDVRAHEHPGVFWSASRVLDIRGEETSPHYPWDPDEGRLQSGEVYKAYSNGWRILVHPATLCIRFDLLLALGGWMALPASEDTALLLALDAVGDGYFNHEVGMIYRRWAPQMSASTEHVDPAELSARRHLAIKRSEVVAELLDRKHPSREK